MHSTPRFLQGMFAFEGKGLDQPVPVDGHVPLRVVEDLDAGTAIELHVAAPAGASGTVVVDLGLVEV